MSDEELIAEFIRTERGPDAMKVMVQMIHWDGRPYDPRSTWAIASALPADAKPAAVDAAICSVLKNPEFFRVCSECLERNPVGWMHGDDLCQGCAQDNHGVVY